eukprot:scaffold870_cov268-Pinguiococcus_pyrenoidosus.AAC.2
MYRRSARCSRVLISLSGHQAVHAGASIRRISARSAAEAISMPVAAATPGDASESGAAEVARPRTTA